MNATRSLPPRLLLAFLCFFLASGLPCLAVEIHVAQENPAADDANAGTAEKPFKTLTAATAKGRLKPGDTLLVHQGVYRETLSLTGGNAHSGKPGAHIRLMAVPGEAVEIKGSNLVTGWKKHKDAPTGAIYVKEDWAANSQQVFCDGEVLTQIAGFVGEGAAQDYWKGRKGNGLADLEEGSFYYDRDAKKLYLWLTAGADPAAHTIEASVRTAGIFVSDLNYYDISGFKITHANLNIGGTYGSHITVDGCDVSYADFCGISLGGSFNSLLNCKSNHNGNSGISTYYRGHRVVGCEVRFNNRRLWSASWHAGGMKNFSSDTIISGCTAEGNFKSPGIWFDGSVANVTIENNRCFHNEAGIMFEIGERAIVRNNVCYENTGRGIYISNSAYCSILFNLCHRNGMSGIVLIGVEREGGPDADIDTTFVPARNNVVWGNLLVDNCHPSLALKGWSGRAELIMPDENIASNKGNISDYNLFHRSDGRGIPFWWNWGVNLCKDLKEWQDKTGQDRHSILAEPLFADAAAHDYRPADKSPAILFAPPRMGMIFDASSRHRARGNLATAGPFDADPKFLPAPRPKPAASAIQLRPVASSFYKPLPAEFAALSDAIAKGLPAGKLANAKTGFTLQSVPIMNATPPVAAVLDKNKRSLQLIYGRAMRTLHMAIGVINPGQGVPLKCKITRQDGTTVELKWESGKNIGPSTGPWDGKLVNEDPDFQTEVAWQSADGQTRLYLVTWQNDNEWYPIKEIEYHLENEAATALVFGTTLTQ